jgi:hypothetical protein
VIGKNKNDQFRPSISVGPNGEVGLFWYDRRNDSANQKTDVYGAFSTNHGASFGALVRVTGSNFGNPKINPNYDTYRSNCDSAYRISSVFPGSGAYVIWGDGRDSGPSANNRVDPNVYFVHVSMPTTTSAVVALAGTSAKVTGAVSPKVPGGKVTATLYRKVSGVYVKVTARTATLDAAGKYSLTFTRTAAGSCEIISKFLGNSEYLASSATKTFAC